MARKKSEKVVFAFAGTAQAVYMEQCARKDNAPGRMIPLPREISAECGMARRRRREAGWSRWPKNMG